jgi:hypothetical protein
MLPRWVLQIAASAADWLASVDIYIKSLTVGERIQLEQVFLTIASLPKPLHYHYPAD